MQIVKQFPGRPRDRGRRGLRLEALEDRLTPSGFGLFELDGGGNTPQGPSLLAPPQLQIEKSVTDGFDEIRPGDRAAYTISVTNNGPGPAFNVTVTDQLPAAELLTWAVSTSTFDVTSVSFDDFLTAGQSSLPAHATIFVTVSAVIPLDVFGLPPVGGTGSLPGGPFELDGNATSGPLTTSHDWDRIYLDVVNRTSTSGAIAGSFVTDAVKSPRDNVFTGRTKDVQGIQSGPWRFQDDKPRAPNDICDAYAATYVDRTTGHVLLYAGLDRYDSGEDATAGFWFFRNPVGASPDESVPGGHPFTGQHSDGDILLVSDLGRGGGAAAIRVFRWTGDDSAGVLVPVTTPAGTAFAAVNDDPITVPWPFRDKGHSSGPAVGEFLEGGVDLTALGLDGCFSSFLAETRTSQSPTASLSDFVIGTFNTCRLELPNSAAVQADGVDRIRSNFVQITVLHDSPPGVSPWFASAPDTLVGPAVRGSGQPARGLSLRGTYYPVWPNSVPEGVMTDAGSTLWRLVTPDITSAATWHDVAPAAWLTARVDGIVDDPREGNAPTRGEGSNRDEPLRGVMGDLWEPGRRDLSHSPGRDDIVAAARIDVRRAPGRW